LPTTYKWNLADVYPTRPAGAPGKRRSPGDSVDPSFEGRLGSDAGTLADALELMTRLDKELSRLYVYASMVADEDSRLSEPQGMQQEMQNLYASFGAQASFVEPELLRVGAQTIESFLSAEPRLDPFAFLLRDVVRRAAHTLSDAEEKLLADASPLASSATNIYTILSNADFPYPTITTSSGER
jgi:oligoendopeptidase F